jgi:FRG domain
MGQLSYFSNFKEKQQKFSNQRYFQIETKRDFDEWYEFYTSKFKVQNKTDFIFRGMSDARFKLYTSAQREWIQNDMEEWDANNFIAFIDRMVQKAKKYPLLNKVFDVYQYSDKKREIPILSILQHYGAPTPLMDWSYNINVSLFFATEKLLGGNGTGNIENYFSIYLINKSNYRSELLNLIDFDNNFQTTILSFREWTESPNANNIFYISDFERGNTYNAIVDSKIRMIATHPLTSIYNQNIIPQEGLFIFNPFSKKTIEDIFNINLNNAGGNLALTPFACFNIKKDLAEYVRRRIKNKFQIDHNFIYPHLYDDSAKIKSQVLDQYINGF